jgi:hypothetical protein
MGAIQTKELGVKYGVRGFIRHKSIKPLQGIIVAGAKPQDPDEIKLFSGKPYDSKYDDSCEKVLLPNKERAQSVTVKQDESSTIFSVVGSSATLTYTWPRNNNDEFHASETNSNLAVNIECGKNAFLQEFTLKYKVLNMGWVVTSIVFNGFDAKKCKSTTSTGGIGLLLVGGIGLLLVVLIAVAILIYVVKKNKRKKEQQQQTMLLATQQTAAQPVQMTTTP